MIIPAALLTLVIGADAGTRTPLTAAEAQVVIKSYCQQCHTPGYLDQQRLTLAGWTATITKMRGWGALLDENQLAGLSEFLAGVRGPTSPLPRYPRVDAKVLAAKLEPVKDPVFANGEPANGEALFAARCLACHGPDARGQIGVNLVSRPLLDRGAETAAYVRVGRGLMVPQADLSDAQVADVLAYLRGLSP